MNVLNREVANVQNPALGALLLWRFTAGYSTSSGGRGPALPVVFLALPVLLHEETARFVIGTQKGSGLRRFREKFTETRREDLAYAIHHRVHQFRALSLASFRLAVHARLLVIDTSAEVLPVSREAPMKKWAADVRKIAAGAEKLGHWLGGVSVYEAASILHVRF